MNTDENSYNYQDYLWKSVASVSKTLSVKISHICEQKLIKMKVDYDVIIIGAGAAGLMAANDLAKTGKNITVLEAKNRLGGRIHTISHPGFSMPVEMGAEFEHGNLELTQKLVKKAGTELYKVGGKIWRQEKSDLKEGDDFIEDYDLLKDAFKKLEDDISVADFFEKYLYKPENTRLKKTLHGYVEGYNAADINIASALTLKEDLENSGNDQYRIKGGYISVIEYLSAQMKKSGGSIFLDTAVHQVNHKKGHVVLQTTKGEFTAIKVIVTVSLGVLQQERIKFLPSIHTKVDISKTMGFGNVIKFIYQFDSAFWETGTIVEERATKKLGFLFSEQPVPTWWSQHPKKQAILTGWIGGPGTIKYQNLEDDALAELGLSSLASIYNLSKNDLRKMLIAYKIIDWGKDLETCGAYSFDTVNSEEKRIKLSEPINDTIYFAGEALAQITETGTVEAALESGKNTAEMVIKSYK
jgi:monoamine oxidase